MSQPAIQVLIVEDDKDSRFLIHHVLKKHYPSAVASEATDGATGLRKFLENGANLLIVDQRIPELNGLDLVREVRARDAGVPIILISNTPSEDLDVFGSGINHFLDKAHLLQGLPLFLSRCLNSAHPHQITRREADPTTRP
jgi:DNA-binding response OmpR family regulator